MLFLLLAISLDTMPPPTLAAPPPARDTVWMSIYNYRFPPARPLLVQYPPVRDTVWMSSGNPLESRVPFDASRWTRTPPPLPPRKKNEP